jgi:hypothetical protein
MSELASLLHVLSTPLGDLLSAAGGGDVKTDELGFVFGALIVLGLAVVVASLLAGGVRGEEGVEERGEAMLAALVAPTSFLIGDVLTARLERGVDGSETAKVGIKLGVGTSAARLFPSPPADVQNELSWIRKRRFVRDRYIARRSEGASPNPPPEPSLSSSSNSTTYLIQTTMMCSAPCSNVHSFILHIGLDHDATSPETEPQHPTAQPSGFITRIVNAPEP